MPEHAIRLVGPWKIQWEQTAETTARFPLEWRSLFGDRAGRAHFSRLFHQPTNLEPHEQVWLEFLGVRGTGTIFLNQQLLGSISDTDSAARFEIARRLQPTNVVSVVLGFDPSATSEPGGIYDVVRLLIVDEPTQRGS